MSSSRSVPLTPAGEHQEKGASGVLLQTLTSYLKDVCEGLSALDERAVTTSPCVHAVIGAGSNCTVARMTIVLLTPTPSPDPFLTVAETAKLLKVGEDTVERLIASGQLKAIEISGKGAHADRTIKRISREAIDEFARNSVAPSKPSKARARSRIDRPTKDYF